MNYTQFLALLLCCFIFSCDLIDEVDDIDESADNESTLYFPPTDSDIWETIDPVSLGWNVDQQDELYDFLSDNGTRAFIVLKDGKIVMEEYWGQAILGNASFDANSQWYWASAGKTITSLLIGRAQQDGFLDIEDKSSDYLGAGWTNMPKAQEDQIKVHHQLSMSTGINHRDVVFNCVEKTCLDYNVDPGEQWFYHNATYLLLKNVITAATGVDYKNYTDQILSPIGLNGQWRGAEDISKVYYSTGREMARFGLLILNEGIWDSTPILDDADYFKAMTTSSQDLNLSYGYLWWLNGESSLMMPQSEMVFNQSLAPDAPSDLIAGMGKNGQYVDVVPSKNIVVVRMGQAPGDDFVPTVFHNEMWSYLSAVIGE
ncbi:MAG: serine hydrolase [Bacteroidota bacterium]